MSNTKADQKEGSPKDQQQQQQQQKSRESSNKPGDSNGGGDAKNTSKGGERSERKNNSNSPADAEQQDSQRDKKIVKKAVTGVVKWFNVVNRYGFISRNDVSEDIFVHQTAIKNFDQKKAVASLGDGEEVEFDVVEGENGPEAFNVTGPNGEPVEGSKHAPEKTSRPYGGGGRGFYRRGYRRGSGRPRNTSSSGGGGQEGEQRSSDREGSAPRNDEDGPPRPRRGRGGFRRGGFRRGPPRDSNGEGGSQSGGDGGGNDNDGPPRRGGRGGRRGRGFRGSRRPPQFAQEG